jgi:hypothetical protein
VSSDPPDGDPYKPLPLQLELPPVKPAVVGIPTRGPGIREERKAVAWRPLIGALGALGAVGVAGLLYGLPRYVRGQLVDQARSHGITLTLDAVSVELSRFDLTNVVMTAEDLPGARLTAPEVEIETSWLQPKKVTAKGMELTFQGRWEALAASFDKWGASDHGFRGSSWASLAPVITDGSRIVWKEPIGEGARIEAAGVHADVSWKAGGTVLHASSDNVSTVLASGTLGPWRVDIDRAPGASRTCVGLDPGIPGTCTVLVVGDDEATTAVDVVLPRTPFTRLGIPLPLIGLHGKDLQVDAAVHYATRGTARADAVARGGMHGIDVTGLPRPFDVALDATIGGDPRAGIDIKQARLAVGPLVGAVRGTFKRFDDGFRLDLAWNGGPAPCVAFDTPLPPGQPFDIAYQLRKLAESAGLTKPKGDVKASATLSFDSRDMSSTTTRFLPETTCGLFE